MILSGPTLMTRGMKPNSWHPAERRITEEQAAAERGLEFNIGLFLGLWLLDMGMVSKTIMHQMSCGILGRDEST